MQDVTDEVIENISAAYNENSPDFIYFITLYNIFNEFLEDISEDVLPNEATGFKESKVWNLLYNFQKDAALAIINKLEKYNGCILADSVGLGKTFTALAVSVNDFFSGETPECRFIDLDFHNDYYELDDIYIAWQYSIYYNYSYFISMYDELLWVVDHNNNSLMYYNKSIYLDNPYDKAEQEFDFEQDIANNKCQKFTLSKRNLRKVLLEQILALKNEQSEDSNNDQT